MNAREIAERLLMGASAVETEPDDRLSGAVCGAGFALLAIADALEAPAPQVVPAAEQPQKPEPKFFGQDDEPAPEQNDG